MEICYVTGNRLKMLVANKIFSPLGVEIIQNKIETPEIQSLDCKEVAEYSAKYAADLLNKPVMKNDSGICIDELKGFPGALTKYVEPTITAEGFIRLLEGKTNRNCHWVEVIAYCEPGKEPISFTSITPGYISEDVRLGRGDEFDKIFIPENEKRTFSQMSEEEQVDYFNEEAYVKLYEYLKEKSE